MSSGDRPRRLASLTLPINKAPCRPVQLRGSIDRPGDDEVNLLTMIDGTANDQRVRVTGPQSPHEAAVLWESGTAVQPDNLSSACEYAKIAADSCLAHFEKSH
jgi:hypothetical protein